MPFTTRDVQASLMRIPAPASNTTGLTETRRLTVDKVTTSPAPA
ncbi:hypothetical protein [Mycobacterium tuberculosis]